jgi:4'-phosphopantetheinyl transferase
MKIGETMPPDRTLSRSDREPLDLWCAYPEDVLDVATADACLSLLSEDEHARWRAYRFDRQRREYLTAHALVRTALSHYYPTVPKAWRFETNDYGKPTVKPDCGLCFNLSNSPDLVVCLIAYRSVVGVDIEPCERAEKSSSLPLGVFPSRSNPP